MFDHLPLVLAQDESPPPEGIQSTPPTPGNNEGQAIEGQDGAAGDQQNQQQGQPQPTSPFGGGFFYLMIAMLVVFWIMLTMGNRREKKKQATLLSSLRKGSKVQTVGGILGTIVEVHSEKIVLKVDENTNTRITVSRAAVQRVLDDDKADKDGGDEDEKK